ncbi:methylthioribose-1-phosphate isomerase, partial [Pyrgilauda ruficollis]|uniref:methylthioribose-1-phosphate isomerase n=1 Tax=Pyrgilauda ruficollis TaxID=221976 RepID=UPI001B87E19A
GLRSLSVPPRCGGLRPSPLEGPPNPFWGVSGAVLCPFPRILGGLGCPPGFWGSPIHSGGSQVPLCAPQVRGAPAIALLGCLSLAVELAGGAGPQDDLGALEEFVGQKLGFLLSARPTAANLGREAERLRGWVRKKVETPGVTPQELRERSVVVGADRVAANGDVANKIGTFQLALAARHLRVPFYVAAPGSTCDPALASGGLIPIEERPGSELTQLGGVLLAEPGGCHGGEGGGIGPAVSPAVVVGADRVAANGDVANKIGTFQLALAARHLRVPFYVAAPGSTCDPALASGGLIPIEERPGSELTQLGGVLLAEPGGCHGGEGG